MQDIWPPGRVVELTPGECATALAEHHVGRIAWCHDGRPHVVPVNFLALDDEVWVRTAPYSELALGAPNGHVSFEVDDIDEFNRSGTSVVVQGWCHRHDGEDGRPPEVDSWAAGSRTLVLRITADAVTGRRLLPS